MLSKEVSFKLLDFVQTADGNTFSIGFMDNDIRKTLSKKTAHAMHEKGQIVKKPGAIEGGNVRNLAPPAK